MERINITLLLIILCFSSNRLLAQDYKFEIGGMAGTSFYMGDANKTKLFQDPGFSAAAIFRYNHNFRWAFKANLGMGHVSGNTSNSNNAFPFAQTVSFERNFYEIGGQIEFNLFNYSNKYSYLDTKPITPYVLLGIGATLGTGNKTFFGMNIPMGIGIKYKWKDRLNLGFEFSFRKLLDDSFDVTTKNGFNLDNPYNIDSNFFKNKDWYSLTMVSLTWDFGPRCKPCLNID